MAPGASDEDLAGEVRGLMAEYIQTRSWAREAQERGCDALLASAHAAAHAHRLCSRAVDACRRVALVLEGVDEARDTRWQLLLLSKTLASLLGGEPAADTTRRAREPRLRIGQTPLALLLQELDKKPSSHGGRSLHERILLVGSAVKAALDARRPAAR